VDSLYLHTAPTCPSNAGFATTARAAPDEFNQLNVQQQHSISAVDLDQVFANFAINSLASTLCTAKPSNSQLVRFPYAASLATAADDHQHRQQQQQQHAAVFDAAQPGHAHIGRHRLAATAARADGLLCYNLPPRHIRVPEQQQQQFKRAAVVARLQGVAHQHSTAGAQPLP
jgi:hypothetical protein